MTTTLNALQSVEIVVPEQPIHIRHYLRQPQRLVHALVEPGRIKQLSEEVFRLNMRPLTFISISIQPTVDMRVWVESNGVIRLQSIACEILGFEYINQRFSLSLEGYLSLEENLSMTKLKGRADLKVTIDLPPPFCFTPKAILETTGNGLLKSVLLTIKQRLLYQLLADYSRWVELQIKDVQSTDITTSGSCQELPMLKIE